MSGAAAKPSEGVARPPAHHPHPHHQPPPWMLSLRAGSGGREGSLPPTPTRGRRPSPQNPNRHSNLLPGSGCLLPPKSNAAQQRQSGPRRVESAAAVDHLAAENGCISVADAKFSSALAFPRRSRCGRSSSPCAAAWLRRFAAENADINKVEEETDTVVLARRHFHNTARQHDEHRKQMEAERQLRYLRRGRSESPDPAGFRRSSCLSMGDLCPAEACSETATGRAPSPMRTATPPLPLPPFEKLHKGHTFRRHVDAAAENTTPDLLTMGMDDTRYASPFGLFRLVRPNAERRLQTSTNMMSLLFGGPTTDAAMPSGAKDVAMAVFADSLCPSSRQSDAASRSKRVGLRTVSSNHVVASSRDNMLPGGAICVTDAGAAVAKVNARRCATPPRRGYDLLAPNSTFGISPPVASIGDGEKARLVCESDLRGRRRYPSSPRGNFLTWD
mgnify:FL=1